MSNSVETHRADSLSQKWLNPFSIGLALLALYAGFNSLWNLASGARSEYYAAIAKSMSLSFSNWFFGAFDPAGSVTLDKIPGSYWVPAIFVKIFGFSTWAVDAPNAMAVIAAAIITVFAVRRLGGNTAGLIAGFVVATTPVLVAVSRANQPQSFFVLALALALLATTKALQTGRRKHLIFVGLYVALGFNFYMLEAWAVWPALIVGWLLLNKKQFRSKTFVVKLVDLAIAGSISVSASIIWPLVVWLVPASSRPFIGGTYHNNPFEMIFGYNGLGRFGATAESAGSSYQTFTPPFAGDPSSFRFFNDQLSGQIAWLLPTALVAVVVLWFTKTSRVVLATLATWFLTFAVMFSAVAGMHQFYTSALAIPVAALVGLAVAEAHRVRLAWGQIALVTSASSTAFFIAGRFWDYFGWVSFVQAFVVLIAIAFFVLKSSKFVRMSAALTAAALLLTPAVWASDAMNHPSSINPAAGAESAMGGGVGGPAGMPGAGGQGGPAGMPGFGGQGGPAGMPGFGPKGGGKVGGNPASDVNTSLVTFLKTNAATSKYQVAMFGGLAAAPYVTGTDLSVLPIGGFSGTDATPTLPAFKKMVSSGQLKYVLGASGGMGGGMGPGTNANSQNLETTSSQIDSWVSENCQTVDYLDASSVSNDASNGIANFFGGDQNPVLYSCKAN